MTETPEPPPTTLVAGPLRRSVRSDTFADITDAEVISFAGGLTFDAALELEQIAAIWARMESTDDADQAHRALLRTPGIVNRCDLLTAYVLGDPLPDPIYPEPLEA